MLAHGRFRQVVPGRMRGIDKLGRMGDVDVVVARSTQRHEELGQWLAVEVGDYMHVARNC